jgi:F0F1-type ATP synthase membrane subunit b/b'
VAPEIVPADVYHLVNLNFWVILVLCVLVILQSMMKVVQHREMRKMIQEVRTLLKMAEVQGQLTELQKTRILAALASIDTGSKTAATIAQQAVSQARTAVDEIPERTAEKVVERIKKADSDLKKETGGTVQ